LRAILLFLFICHQIPAFGVLKYQSSKKDRHRVEQKPFSLKTDFLQLLNSVIEPNNIITGGISGELNFNEIHGLQIHVGMSSIGGGYKVKAYNTGAEFKWYLWCDCYSGLHAGLYSDFQFSQITIEDINKTKNIRYNESKYEGGLAAGYLVIISDHLIIDPIAHVGYCSSNNNRQTKFEKASYTNKEPEMVVAVLLEVGYRF
jgi:hypothetical protein